MYFSGFCLENEKELFSKYLINNDFTVSGFSLGAIKAFEEAVNLVENNKRIDLLQLFSPSYFCNESEKFKRKQLIFYKKDENTYIENFLLNIAYPNVFNMNKYYKKGEYIDLEYLLNFTWDIKNLEFLVQKNVKIEVYLGEQDKIINSKVVNEFFKSFAKVYYIKSCGHILLDR